MAMNPLFDNVPDENLGDLLYQLLVVEGHAEVEVKHPTEGLKIVTKDNYKKILSSIVKVKKLSPAKRLIEERRIKNAFQIKHRTDMLEAKFYTVDIQDEENFGKDVNGEKIDMVGMTFIPVIDYIKGIQIQEREFGAFIHPANSKKPSRIITTGSIDAE